LLVVLHKGVGATWPKTLNDRSGVGGDDREEDRISSKRGLLYGGGPPGIKTPKRRKEKEKKKVNPTALRWKDVVESCAL